MKKIGILTYDAKHRKTYDTLCLLKTNGYENITVYAQPFHYTKKFFPILEHRPEANSFIPELDQICNNFGFKLMRGHISEFEFDKDMLILVCGAGIIPEEVIANNLVINAHPGYIPYSRGLDSFKWAIWEGIPVGVTTHIIGNYIDAGEIIEKRKIQVKENDTFFQLAQRVYDNEVSMLVEAIEKIDENNRELCIPESDNIHKRMPHEIENKLLERFEEYKKVQSKSK